jgi:hypothetical protein
LRWTLSGFGAANDAESKNTALRSGIFLFWNNGHPSGQKSHADSFCKAMALSISFEMRGMAFQGIPRALKGRILPLLAKTAFLRAFINLAADLCPVAADEFAACLLQSGDSQPCRTNICCA